MRAALVSDTILDSLRKISSNGKILILKFKNTYFKYYYQIIGLLDL